ncbi:MAG: hypothetical protein AABX07_00880 [Nanoarchaeota archaeon]
MGLRGIVIAGLIILLVIILVAIGIYKVSHVSEKEKLLSDAQFALLSNPTAGLNESEAVLQFNESFIYYFLYSINAQNLRNPKIKFVIDDEIFSAILDSEKLIISRENIQEEDIIIKTTKKEAIKMLRDKNYISASFNDGASSIEMAAGKITLLSKGYLNLYKELTGKSITGNFLRV